jgi:hypothetical protein
MELICSLESKKPIERSLQNPKEQLETLSLPMGRLSYMNITGRFKMGERFICRH